MPIPILATCSNRDCGWDIQKQLGTLQQQLNQITDENSLLLTQAVRNEGFRQLSPLYFQRAPTSPEPGWRTTFTLADVHAGIPARRHSHDTQYTDEELLASLREGDNRLVVGRAGDGKSTRCKQAAVMWYRTSETGPVLYRASDHAGAAFESRAALREAIDRAERHVLVVIEDAARANANVIFHVIQEYKTHTDVSFLLDACETELRRELDAQTVNRSSDIRQREIVRTIERYELPAISVADVARTIDAFEEATGKTVEHSARALHEEIQSEAAEGFGGFLLLAFHLPLDGGQSSEARPTLALRPTFVTVPDGDAARE